MPCHDCAYNIMYHYYYYYLSNSIVVRTFVSFFFFFNCRMKKETIAWNGWCSNMAKIGPDIMMPDERAAGVISGSDPYRELELYLEKVNVSFIMWIMLVKLTYPKTIWSCRRQGLNESLAFIISILALSTECLWPFLHSS